MATEKQYLVYGHLFVLTRGTLEARDLVIEAFSDSFVQASMYLQKRRLEGVKLELFGVDRLDRHHTAVAMTMTGTRSMEGVKGAQPPYREWMDPDMSRSLRNPNGAPLLILPMLPIPRRKVRWDEPLE